jgi:hypothetical protein
MCALISGNISRDFSNLRDPCLCLAANWLIAILLQLRDLIAHFECQAAIAQAPESISSDIQGGTILPVVSAPSSSSGSLVRGTRNGKQK